MIPNGMTAYGRLCGWTLARAHARSGDRIAIAAYLGRGRSFDRAILGLGNVAVVNDERFTGDAAISQVGGPEHREAVVLRGGNAPEAVVGDLLGAVVNARARSFLADGVNAILLRTVPYVIAAPGR
jgi:hypothetical protein